MIRVAAFSRRGVPSALHWTFLLGLTALPLKAHADTPSAAPSVEAQAELRRGAAKEKFEQGVEAYKEQRFAAAVKLFLEADSLAPSAALSFNIARAFERLEDTSGALRWYRDFLRRNPAAANAAEVREKVTALAATLAQQGVQQVSVISDPAGATVLIDEQNFGVTPLTRDLPPGPHRVVVRLEGYKEHAAELNVAAKTPQDVLLRLEKAPVVPNPVERVPGGSPGGLPREPGKRFGVVPYVVMGAGAASLLGALGFELGRRSADSAAEDASQREFQEHYDTMESRQLTARVLAGVGGALLATGGVLFIVDFQRKSSPQLALGCDEAGCGLLAKGSFQ